MSAQHTQGRVKVQHPHAGERGWEVAFEPGLEQLCQDITEANARRLVACWNAFDGLDTEQIESMVNVPSFFFKHIELLAQRDELLAMLNRAVRRLESAHASGETIMRHWIVDARALIAKVEGEKT